MKRSLLLLWFSLLVSLAHYTAWGQTNHKEEIYKKADYYRTKYGIIKAKTDTLIKADGNEFYYKNGFLMKVGKVKNNKPIGEWYLFSDSLRLNYVLKYKSNKVDTIHRPFHALINESW